MTIASVNMLYYDIKCYSSMNNIIMNTLVERGDNLLINSGCLLFM